jgi:hypothetical protein
MGNNYVHAKAPGKFTKNCYGIVTIMLQYAHCGVKQFGWASIDFGLKRLVVKGFYGTEGGFGIIKLLKIGFGGKALC